MPITKRPIYDCLSCDAFEPDQRDPRRGWCHRNPPSAQITGVDKLGQPMITSVNPPVGKGFYCLQHPMAKAFPPGEFVPPKMGETEPISAGPVDPEPPPVVMLDEPPEPPLPGEARPEKPN